MSINMPLDTTAAELPVVRAGKPAAAKSNRRTYTKLMLGWFVLTGIGAAGAKLYTDHLKAQLTRDIAVQTQVQLQSVQNDYRKQVADLKNSVDGDMTQLQAKVDTLNELLSFVKDSASSKTDNSNQLYTQLGDVNKKLDELKSNLDMLK